MSWWRPSRLEPDSAKQCHEFSGWFRSPFKDEYEYHPDGTLKRALTHGKGGAYCSFNAGHRGPHSWADDPYLRPDLKL